MTTLLILFVIGRRSLFGRHWRLQRQEWSDAQGACSAQRRVPFEFSGAVRPTDPEAWPQVE